MMIHKQLFVFWIFMYTCLLTEGIAYLGCYEDDREPNRVLPTQQKDNHKTNTPEDCARRCSQYRYAGVESGEECFCGDRMNNPQKILDWKCNYRCPGGGSKMCGGDWKISVYTNWVCGPPPAIANGNATLRKDANIIYGSVADVICKPGFNSTPTITCLSNTSWEKATCEQPSTTTASTTPTSSHDASSESLTTVIPNTATPPINSPAASTTSSQTTVPSPSSFTSATSGNSSTSDMAVSAFKDSSQGASPAATAAGVSVAVALAIAAIVIVLVLRKRGKLCFAITKRSTLENTDDYRNISLARKESKQNDDYQSQGAPLSNRTYVGVQKKGAINTDKYYAVVGNNCALTESTPNGSYTGPVVPVSTGMSKEGFASKDKDVNYQNTTGKLAESEAHSYFVLEKDGFQQNINATSSHPVAGRDYFVLEKQQIAIRNGNDVSTNEIHPYFVLETKCGQPAHETPSNEDNPYFVLEKQTTGNSTQINTANTIELDTDDGNMYQEIDTNATYAGIGDSRQDNNDYDYTNKSFSDSNTKISDNVYNHLNSAGDEYDYVGKGKSNVNAIENNYDITSGAVRM